MADRRWGKSPRSSFEQVKRDETVLKLIGFVSFLVFVLLWLWSQYAPTSALGQSRSSLVISEFMASNDSTLADEDGDYPDWVEIHNRSTTDVNLGGWYLTDDERDLTKWQFPSITLEGNGYLVVFASNKDRASADSELHTNFNLADSGEYLALIQPDGATVAWEYTPEYPLEFEGLSYPWAARLMGRRGITAKHPPQFADVSYGLDRALNERYFTVPTPGAMNGKAPPDQGPIIGNVGHLPLLPTSGDAITVTVTVKESPAPLAEVCLHYRVMYEDTSTIPMFDDGSHGDGAPGDGTYGATIPNSAHQAGDMVRYYITAVDREGHPSRWPLFHDPANWPEYLGTMVADPSVDSALPVLYWFVEDPAAAETGSGTRAAVFYNGVLYDNVLVRPRGGLKARSWPKKSFKFDFHKGYYFQFSPDEAPVEEFNLNTTYSDKSYLRRILAWETYRDASVFYSISFPMRVQQNAEFYSVAIFVEQPDERYLERQGLDPAGALYKMRNLATSATDGALKRTRLNEDHSDLQALIDGIHLPEPERTFYLFDQVDIPAAINYLAASTIMHDNDHIRLNYYLYRDTEGTGEWLFLPWDKDLTFGRNNLKDDIGVLNDMIWADDDPYSHPLLGSSDYPKAKGLWNHFIDALYDTPAIREMYLRRLRTLMDELLQPPGTPPGELHYEQRIDELVAQMQPDVLLDAARWPPDWGSPQTFAEAVDILKREYLAVRRVHLFETHGPANDGIIPDSQSALANVEFGKVESAPVSGDQDEEYLTLVNPTSYALDISGWTIGGDIEYVFQAGVVIPAGGTLYVSPDVVAFRHRATSPRGGEGRFVQGDYTGRLSNTWGVLTLSSTDGQLVTSATFFDLSLSREPVTITLF
jgi:hypothetical protein